MQLQWTQELQLSVFTNDEKQVCEKNSMELKGSWTAFFIILSPYNVIKIFYIKTS